VEKSLAGKIPLIVDGGQSQVGIESTVLDLSSSPPRLLRPGMITAEPLLAVIGATGLAMGSDSAKVLRSPGMLPRHYSPKARLVILGWKDEAELAKNTSIFNVSRDKIHVIAHTQIPRWENFGRVSVIPHDAQAYARAIYSELHACDEEGAELIIVEELPATEEWSGIADRLRRASRADFSG
jgi:L-threonylcarbamoyladenylate synthase